MDIWCWVLMYYIDYKNKIIRSEFLCLLKFIENGKFFIEYYERIILKEISFDFEFEFDIIFFFVLIFVLIDFEIKCKNV